MNQKTKFKQTEIGMIPEDWDVKPVGDLVKINEDTINKDYPEKEIEYIDVSSVNNRRLLSVQKMKLEEAPSRAKRIVKDNDILISTVRPNLKHFCFIKQSKKNLIASTGYAVISSKKINPNFLYYYLTTNRYIDFLTSIADSHTSTYPSFNPDVIENSLCPFPLEIEQTQIAKILSDLDSKIELFQKQNQTLEKIGQALFKHWFVDFEFPNEKGKPYKSSGGEMVDSELGEIPKGWGVSKIGDEFETILGGTPSTSNKSYWENGTIPWINSGAINDFPIINASQYITEAGLKNSATKLMPKKTVVLPFVISINKDIRISITGIETSGNQSVLGIVENEKIPCEFIYYWVEKMKDDIYSWVTGGAQQHINKNNVDNTLILIPNNNIMNNFKELLIPIFDKILNNSYETKNLSQIRDSLLPKLMSGKMRVPVEVKI